VTDIWDSAKRSEVMRLVRSKGNRSTELALAAILRKGRVTGWRRHLPLPGRPDFFFPRAALAVFVDGCFWHFCPRCYRRPKSNQAFWDEKARRNRERDRRVDRDLKKRGKAVLRFYEHELKNPTMVMRKLTMALEKARGCLRGKAGTGKDKNRGKLRPKPPGNRRAVN
jgi:DNA mismatch endonuclease (patch repair protein)